MWCLAIPMRTVSIPTSRAAGNGSSVYAAMRLSGMTVKRGGVPPGRSQTGRRTRLQRTYRAQNPGTGGSIEIALSVADAQGLLADSTTLSAPNAFVIRFVLSERLFEK